jgi:hypothetical protein
MTRHRDPVRCFYVAEGKWDLLGWLRGPDTE